MEFPLKQTEYYTGCGQFIGFRFEEITLSSINDLVEHYCSITGREPTHVVVGPADFSELVKHCNHTTSYTDSRTGLGFTVLNLYFRRTGVKVKCDNEIQIPLFVGTETEYEQTKINKHFEEIVLAN